jgi:mono/diheme cytochrome c family protein
MKKNIIIAFLMVAAVSSCNKKIAPAASSTSGTTGGSVSTASSPASKMESGAPMPTGAATTTGGSTSVPVLPAEKTGSKSDANPPKTIAPEVAGQNTYNTKCGKCHGLKVASNYTADRWISIMQVMATKAQLTAEEKENVLAYVKANAKK